MILVSHPEEDMRQLSGLDATFLYIETPEMPMHVGGLHLLDASGLSADAFASRLRQHMRARMHLAPVFYRKLAVMPLGVAHPVWVDDDQVDLDVHIRLLTLPRPGTPKQLEALVGKLHGELLDRGRPLWQFNLIAGLKGGALALYTKLHHAAIDGQAGVAVANAILDVTPEPRVVAASERKAGNRVKLGTAELIGAALSNQLMQIGRMVKMLPGAAKTVTGAVTAAAKSRSKAQNATPDDAQTTGPRAQPAWQLAPRTPLNGSITASRAFASVSIPLARVKTISKMLAVSLNDIVLSLCSTSLRNYLTSHEALPNKKSLIAAIPVSLRGEGDMSHNNQVTMFMVNLASDVVDPIDRVMAIRASTQAMKAQVGALKSLIPTDYPSIGTPWLVSGLAQIYGRTRLADKLPNIANLVISNVPGPQFPLYLAGARMQTYFPVSIPVHGMALNITVQSYDGSLDCGLIACRKTVPDVQTLASGLSLALSELEAAVAARAAALALASTPVDAPAAKVAGKARQRARTPAATKAPTKIG
jgi:diacylglycerol O-acyltransferase / wax synthase